MQDFRKLDVWHKAHELTLEIYRATKAFPTDEKYGLTSQLRRAAASVPANIAEGCGRDGNRELLRFLAIACGSASETDYHLMLSHDLGYMPKEKYDRLAGLAIEIRRMLWSLRDRIQSNLPAPHPRRPH